MKKIYVFFFLVSSIFANDNNLLTNIKQEIIHLQKKQIEQKEKINKYNWLSNVNLSSSILEDNENIQSKDHYISISQDIYKFGGINSQIKYSKELGKLEQIALKSDTNSDIYTLYTYLIDMKLNEISLKINFLNLKNTQIDITHKKSEYKAGEIGISDLNKVIMTKNTLRDSKKNIELSQLKTANNLKKYTDENISKLLIPRLNLMSKEFFLQKSIAIKSALLTSKVNNLSYEVKKSEYLPKLSFNTKYGYKNSDNSQSGDYYNYGLNIFIPISFTSKNHIEQSRLTYLISKQELFEKQNDIKLLYDEAIFSIQNYEEKIKLALEDIRLYNELIFLNEEEYKAGYKTIDDVETLKNSKKIREYNIKTYKLNIKKELISLYTKVL